MMFWYKKIPKKWELEDISSCFLAEAVIGEMNSGTVSDFKILKKTNRGQVYNEIRVGYVSGSFSC